MQSTHPNLPRYARIRDDLARAITGGRWAAGTAIDPELELARHYGVALGTVRKAVDMLVAEGLLERRQGSGTYVRRPSFDRSLFRFFSFADESGRQRQPQSRIVSHGLATLPDVAAKSLGLARNAQALRLRRLRAWDETPFLTEEIWLDRKRFAGLLKLERDGFAPLLYPQYEASCGVMIAAIEEELRIVALTARDATTLGVERATPGVEITRVAFTADGTAVEWRRSIGRSDLFRYRVRVG